MKVDPVENLLLVHTGNLKSADALEYAHSVFKIRSPVLRKGLLIECHQVLVSMEDTREHARGRLSHEIFCFSAENIVHLLTKAAKRQTPIPAQTLNLLQTYLI